MSHILSRPQTRIRGVTGSTGMSKMRVGVKLLQDGTGMYVTLVMVKFMKWRILGKM